MDGDTPGLSDPVGAVLTLNQYSRGPVHLRKHHQCGLSESQTLKTFTAYKSEAYLVDLLLKNTIYTVNAPYNHSPPPFQKQKKNHELTTPAAKMLNTATLVSGSDWNCCTYSCLSDGLVSPSILTNFTSCSISVCCRPFIMARW